MASSSLSKTSKASAPPQMRDGKVRLAFPGGTVIEFPGVTLVTLVALAVGALLIIKGVDPEIIALWLKVRL